jgi:PAS domain S-box-containing protein
MVGRRIWDHLIPAAEIDSVKEVFRALVERRPGRPLPARHENHWLTRAGGSRLIRWSNRVVLDARGGCRYVVATGIDVTAQRRAERQARDSDELFRSVFEQAAVGIAQVGLDGRWLQFNDALCHIVGYGREALSRKTFQEITHPDDLDADLEKARRLGAGEIDTYSIEKRYLRPDGSTVWAHLTGSAVRGPGGEALYFVAVVEDISRSVQVRQALLDSEARTRGVVETAADAIVTVEEDGTIESLNPAALRMFGYAHREIVGRNVNQLMPEPYRSEHDGYLRQYLRTNARRVIGVGREVVCRRKDGSTFACDLSVGEVRLRDRRLFTGILRDATDRKRAQEMRAEKEAADAANRAKDEVLAVVAHDLRTPLGAIGIWAHLLKTKDLNEAGRREAVDAILDAVRVQQRLIDDLLDASRIVSGTLKLQVCPLDLTSVVRAALETVGAGASEKGLLLEADLPDEPVPVMGDPVRLRQVLWNLLSNAIKFTPGGGRVRVTLRRNAGATEVRVSDTGCGISRDSVSRVFDRYWQGRLSRDGGGLGLGLAIVRHVVELHGGTVMAESEGPGKGATFAVTIPLAAE